MKKFLCSLFSAVLLSSGISVWAQQDLTIKKVSAENAAISMDGSADEPIWSQIEAIPIDKPFKRMRRSQKSARHTVSPEIIRIPTSHTP